MLVRRKRGERNEEVPTKQRRNQRDKRKIAPWLLHCRDHLFHSDDKAPPAVFGIIFKLIQKEAEN
jgi:hypothetical protein